VYPMRAKSEVFMCFKQFVSFLALKMFLAVNWAPFVLIRGEYMSKEFNAFLADHGIKHQCIVPYTP